jgi:hypothetical protein
MQLLLTLEDGFLKSQFRYSQVGRAFACTLRSSSSHTCSQYTSIDPLRMRSLRTSVRLLNPSYTTSAILQEVHPRLTWMRAGITPSLPRTLRLSSSMSAKGPLVPWSCGSRCRRLSVSGTSNCMGLSNSDSRLWTSDLLIKAWLSWCGRTDFIHRKREFTHSETSKSPRLPPEP